MRYVFVANRLPFRLVPEGRSFQLQPSPGGVATSLSAYTSAMRKEHEEVTCISVGWPGATVAQKEQQGISQMAWEKFRAHPVYLSDEAVEHYYFGFCNQVLWPLFHYFPESTRYEEKYWHWYVRVNQQFAERILAIRQPGDIICVQDYQLLLLPAMLREYDPRLTISFFLHTPFPTYEMYRLLPKLWRSRLLEGMLGADQIGFHTHDYTQYFLSAVERILGFSHVMGTVSLSDRRVTVDTFPLGIDYAKYHDAVEEASVATERRKVEKTVGKRKVILSVDRLDYTKGISERLRGYELFLTDHPEWHDRVVLLLQTEPSRTQILRYKQTKDEIEQLFAQINKSFGTPEWTPVLYTYGSLSFTEMVSRYSLSDVALITPLRDGMNLIAKEYVASSSRKQGVLILSELAGSVKELSEAIFINPNMKEDIAEAIERALTMPEEEKSFRLGLMQQQIKKYDVYHWAETVNASLHSFMKQQHHGATRLTASVRSDLIQEYQRSHRRLIFLDYDGTLVPFAPTPEKASPPKAVLDLLGQLIDQPQNEVVLISGRDRETMQEWFPIRNLAMVAEHGVWVRERYEYYWKLRKRLRAAWKKDLRPLLEQYTERVPGTFIEEKDYSLAWHYRLAEAAQTENIVRELTSDLVQFTANTEIGVLSGSKVVEVKTRSITKGAAAIPWLEKKQYDFFLAIGDDTTDEDLFAVLPPEAHTIKVGSTSPHARWTVASPQDVQALLRELLRFDARAQRGAMKTHSEPLAPLSVSTT